ncbi:MAG: dTMP kinase, partial [Treponema maltophilum]
VFYFRIDPEIALKRIQNRSVVEIYEKLDFLQKTAAAYDKIFAAFDKKNTGMNIIRIDASLDAAEIEKIIWSALQKLPIFES